ACSGQMDPSLSAMSSPCQPAFMCATPISSWTFGALRCPATRNGVVKNESFPRWVTLLSWVALIVAGAAMASGWLAVPARHGSGLADGVAALRASDYAMARHVFEGLADKNDPAGELWLA